MAWDGDIPVLASSNTFWTQPAVKKQDLDAIIPKKDTWTLTCVRRPHVWDFDMPEYGVEQEALCHGTELVLDNYFRQLTGYLPRPGDILELTVSINRMDKCTTKIVHVDKDLMDSNNYLDVYTKMDVWLCPFLQLLFKDVPEILYLQMTPELCEDIYAEPGYNDDPSSVFI